MPLTSARKLRIVHGVRIDEPALAGGSRVHPDDVTRRFAEMQVAERRHFKAQAAQASRLVGRQAGSVPAGERGGDNGIELGLGEIRLGWPRRGLRIAGRLLEPVAVQRDRSIRAVEPVAVRSPSAEGRRSAGCTPPGTAVRKSGASSLVMKARAKLPLAVVLLPASTTTVGFGCGIAGRNDIFSSSSCQTRK